MIARTWAEWWSTPFPPQYPGAQQGGTPWEILTLAALFIAVPYAAMWIDGRMKP